MVDLIGNVGGHITYMDPIWDMGVSKNSGTPKWMVYFMENPIKMYDLGGFYPYFWFNTHIGISKKYRTLKELQGHL